MNEGLLILRDHRSVVVRVGGTNLGPRFFCMMEPGRKLRKEYTFVMFLYFSD